ncbi:hypothetical protein RJT34_07346 [Clitoria ternatea]|uniref:Uncharacterized protein n=1 Tax=Clitoria ternatea TaxID=43366 RepID=A0AAN9K6H4_CLITE
MSIKIHQIKVPIILNWIIVLICVATPVKSVELRKLDETTVATPNGNEKCTPCGGGGYTPSSPPPIVYLSPPPPSPPPPLIYPSPPPPPKKTPSSYCPPPPSSYIYMTGPPGNLYPVDENFSGASSNRHQNLISFLPLLVGLLGMLAFW